MKDREESIPRPVVAVVAETLATVYAGTRIKTLFEEHGAPGDPPAGGKVDMTRKWRLRVNEELSAPLAFLGAVLLELMETEGNAEERRTSDGRTLGRGSPLHYHALASRIV